MRQGVILPVSVALLLASAPRFAAAETGRALSGAEIRAAFAGKVLEYRNTRQPKGGTPGRPSGYEPRAHGGYALVTVDLRQDGSINQQCRNFDGRGGSLPC